MTILLIHGGLGETTGADRFWVQPGIVAGLDALGFDVLAPDRDTTPTSWLDAATDTAHLLAEAATVVAGSNGVSVALRLALDQPKLVARLVLLWPATAGDPSLDAQAPSDVKHLLPGDTIRGVADADLGHILVPTSIMASEPDNRFHQHRTVHRLLDLIEGSRRIKPDFPESVRPEFLDDREGFLDAVRPHLGPPDGLPFDKGRTA